MKQVGTPSTYTKNTLGLIRHNLHANKCSSKTAVGRRRREKGKSRLWQMEFAKLPD